MKSNTMLLDWFSLIWLMAMVGVVITGAHSAERMVDVTVVGLIGADGEKDVTELGIGYKCHETVRRERWIKEQNSLLLSFQ